MKSRQSLSFALLTTVVVSLTACGPEKRQIKGGTPETGPGTATAARKYLEGPLDARVVRGLSTGQTAGHAERSGHAQL